MKNRDFECSNVTSSLQPPFSSLNQCNKNNNYSVATLWYLYDLLEYHIHIILLNCTTIPLRGNYHPYFTVEKNEAQKGEKFSHRSVIQWNSKSGLSGYGGGARPAHFPLYHRRRTRELICLWVCVRKWTLSS